MMSQGVVRKMQDLFSLAKASEYNISQYRVTARLSLFGAYSVADTKLAQCLILVHQDQLFILQERPIVQMLADQDEKHNHSWLKEWITFYTWAHVYSEGRYFYGTLAFPSLLSSTEVEVKTAVVS